MAVTPSATEPGLLPGPLHGIRILDFTNMMSGPYCTRLLADMGAEVLKIEPPSGDHNRTRRPVRQGYSSFFGQMNCGKKSIVLDLKSRDGLDAALGLAARCDVVVENWRPGVADRLGVGYAALAAIRPTLVYCSISGFGQKGPKALRPAYAAIVHAASGYDLAQVEYQGGGRPANTGTFIGDAVGGMAAFAAIQGALFQRERTGRGQYIDVAMLDGMLNLMVHEAQEAQSPSDETMRVYEPLATRDGFIIVAPTTHKNFLELAAAVGRPEWADDPRFRRTREREAHWHELMQLIEEWTSQRTGAECEAVLLAAGVPCTRYQTVAETLADPQLQARGSLTRIDDPAGSYLIPNAPFQMPGVDTAPRNRVAALGEDGAAVLGELLGYDADRVRRCAGG
ncbi:CoA transferase [Pigmentiphaga soli]|uniref:CoA transferase n=1 Tax=Pigmentiphaga soli TaxID=1007095 RepID=A0ABP8GF03_9BURK